MKTIKLTINLTFIAAILFSSIHPYTKVFAKTLNDLYVELQDLKDTKNKNDNTIKKQKQK